MKKPRYDLQCAVDPEKQCPAKLDIIGEATGDRTGCAPIDSELAERIVMVKFLEQDAVAHAANLIGLHGDITDTCPVRPAMNENVVRKSVLSMIRGGYHRYSNRQTR